MKEAIGILAYGSLIGDPGREISQATIETRHGVVTPFNIEFARSSRGRGGAPTLVPIKKGGAQVSSRIFVVDVPEREAANRLWRREIGRVGSGGTYYAPEQPRSNHVLVKRLENFAELDVVLYTEIAANIEPLTAKNLARLAVESVKKTTQGRDGISYLMDTKRNGIVTALSDDYESEILKTLMCATLQEGLAELLK